MIADQCPSCTHVSSPCRQPLPSQTTRCRPLTARACAELHKPLELFHAGIGPGFLILTSFIPSTVAPLGMQIPLAARDALVHELAQLLPHVVSGHDLVLDVAQEEHGRPGRDDQDLGGGVPLEGAEEYEGPEEGHRRGAHAWEREKCVFGN